MRAQLLLVIVATAMADAQSPPRPLQFDVVYSCSGGRTKLKVLGCAGASDADACDVQYLDATSPQGLGARISAPRKQVAELLQTCVIQKPPAKVETPPAPTAPKPVPRKESQPAQVQRQAPIPEAGPAVARPAPRNQPQKVISQMPANRTYFAGDRVQVLFESHWIDSQILTVVGGTEFRVKLPGNREAWTTAPYLRPAPPAPVPAQAPAAAAAKPRGAPCGSKLEGRWGSSTGVGIGSIEFRAGKAYMEFPFLGKETLDCSIVGDKIILTKPGEPDEAVFRFNDDGTIEAPVYGEFRRKGK